MQTKEQFEVPNVETGLQIGKKSMPNKGKFELPSVETTLSIVNPVDTASQVHEESASQVHEES